MNGDQSTETDQKAGQAASDSISVPSGPFVWYGRYVGAVVAPGQGTGRYDIISTNIFVAHLFVAGLAHLLLPAGTWMAVVGIVVLGIVTAARYGSNCAARHEKFIAQLREKYPDADVKKI